eukprot:gnl/TRDRNA2_/TRDRNA2_173279_c0_seq4.p1 gnl/TRDRNA2_/TRDRNA2_173279_c0~~gnl/TRDRNA2_/TRDRNA2_173279_c0_seq4.p1  ORF type:complete len:445 (+),score=47.94 gnl/TRDRNA2_/TRDRNA2_173279_c0_seq4:33-1367(+)
MKIIVFMLVITHLIACGWYSLGKYCGDYVGNSWTLHHRLEHESVGERYIWSFHYAMAIFNGEHVTTPQNIYERTFTVFVLLITFVLSAWFVSSITTAMTRLQIISGQRSMQFSALNRYLINRDISRELAIKVMRNAQHALAEQKRNAPESSIELLGLISEPLQAELHFEINSPILFVHPFFQLMNEVNPGALRKICHTAVSGPLSLSQGDVLFSDLEIPVLPKMIFPVSGKLLYLRERTSPNAVTRGMWICEAVLWTSWVHRGTLRASNESQIMSLSSQLFQSIAKTIHQEFVRTYASEFCSVLQSMCYDKINDLAWDEDRQSLLIEAAFKEFNPEGARTESGGRASLHPGRVSVHPGGLRRLTNTTGVQFSQRMSLFSNMSAATSRSRASVDRMPGQNGKEAAASQSPHWDQSMGVLPQSPEPHDPGDTEVRHIISARSDIDS